MARLPADPQADEEGDKHEQIEEGATRGIVAQDGIAPDEEEAKSLPGVLPECPPKIAAVDVRVEEGDLPGAAADQFRLLDDENEERGQCQECPQAKPGNSQA